MSQDGHQAFSDSWRRHCGLQREDTQLAARDYLSLHFPDHHVTRISACCDLFGFASAGFATFRREVLPGFDATRTLVPSYARLEQDAGKLTENIKFGRWLYTWKMNEFIVYQIQYDSRYGPLKLYFILAPRATNKSRDGHHSVTDSLILAASRWAQALHDEIYVFDDQMWEKDKKLYQDVQDASWDDVILDPAMKRNLLQDVLSFFDNKDLYQNLKVPWKRGVIFHGVPGNGKTISLKALINSLSERDEPIPSLYVKSFDGCRGEKYSIQSIFSHARTMAPCLLIFEDLDSLVRDECRSYFLNEVDGLESNDGILMIGSTNHLDRLDAAITKRPSRFDRKYHFKIPGLGERLEYCRFWRQKFKSSADVDFPDDICPPIAAMTEGFSFAYLKELFVTSLLELARGSTGESDDDDEDDDGDASESEAAPSDGTSVTDGVIVEDPSSAPAEPTGSAAQPPNSADNADAATQTQKPQEEKPQEDKVKRVLPEVEIPDGVKENVLLKIILKQAGMLLDEMDNTDEAEDAPKKTLSPEVVRGFSRRKRALRAQMAK